MIRNIPNKYDQMMLFKELDYLYQYRFDFFYLPMDINVRPLL
jgi:hypothetical protein